jgi:hypothetical protein
MIHPEDRLTIILLALLYATAFGILIYVLQ